MAASRRIVVFGAGGHGKVVAEIALLLGLEVVAFVDDASAGSTHFGRPVLPLARLLAEAGRWPTLAALGIGGNGARRQSAARLREQGFELATLAHPSAIVSASARLGRGVVIAAGAAINAEATIGDGAIINTNAIVEHDCAVAAFAHVGAGSTMCGGSALGEGSVLGAGAVLPVFGKVASGVLVPPGVVFTGAA